MRATGERPASTGFDHSVLINAPPKRVLEAFFDPIALAEWWQATRSVTTPRPLGVYAIEWEPTTELDEVLGRLGGVFHGQVIEYQPGREFFVADAWWLPPDGDPLGPMSLQVNCVIDGPACQVARPAERRRRRTAVGAVLRRHRQRMDDVDGRAEAVHRGGTSRCAASQVALTPCACSRSAGDRPAAR